MSVIYSFAIERRVVRHPGTEHSLALRVIKLRRASTSASGWRTTVGGGGVPSSVTDATRTEGSMVVSTTSSVHFQTSVPLNAVFLC